GTDGGYGFYSGPLEDAQRMIDKGVAAGVPNWEAVGRIMKSYVFSVMTDAMGDLPYSETLKGEANLTPKYDSQQAIYTALFDDYGMSKTFVDSLLSWKDPRLPVFAQLNKDTIVANRTYRGLPNGLNDGAGDPLFLISRYGAYWRETPNAPLELLTYSELLFLE